MMPFYILCKCVLFLHVYDERMKNDRIMSERKRERDKERDIERRREREREKEIKRERERE